MEKDGHEFEDHDVSTNPGHELDAHDLFYITAFHDLSSERQVGEAVNPIPYMKIVDYCAHVDIRGDDAEDLAFVMRIVDNAYIESIINRQKKAIKDGKHKPQGVRKKDGKDARRAGRWS